MLMGCAAAGPGRTGEVSAARQPDDASSTGQQSIETVAQPGDANTDPPGDTNTDPPVTPTSSSDGASGICDRTPEVAEGIVRYLGRYATQLGVTQVSDCAHVKAPHLAAVLALDLTNRDPKMTALQLGDFAGLTSMRRLFLHGNALTALPDRVFEELSSLETLALYNNDLESVSAETFAGLTSLTKLHMHGNALSTVPDDAFSNVPSLTELHLGGNRLTEFRREIITGLSSLEMLWLWENEITELAPDNFAGLTSLKKLDLMEAGFHSIPAGLFAGSSLTEIWLAYNQLTELPAGAFAGLSNLEVLILGHNELTELPDRVFAGLTSLVRLHLYDNAVQPVPLTVALEAAGTMQFKVTVPSGAPFDVEVPVAVTNGSLVGGASTVTVRKGDLESASHEVIRTPGSTGAVSVEIGDLPSPPDQPSPPVPHVGYALVKGPPLPL